MNCRECRVLLQQEADGEERLAPAALEQHLHICPGCRAFQSGLHRLLACVEARTPPCPTPEFADRLLQAVLADPLRPQPRPEQTPSANGLPWVLLLALAASLLLGLSLALQRPLLPESPTPSGPEVTIAALPVAPVEPVVPAESPANLRDSVREAQSALTALTSRTADEVVERTRQLLPSVPAPLLPEFEPMPQLVEPPGHGLSQAGQVVADGLQPVTNSAHRAFHLFLRELPLGVDAEPDL